MDDKWLDYEEPLTKKQKLSTKGGSRREKQTKSDSVEVKSDPEVLVRYLEALKRGDAKCVYGLDETLQNLDRASDVLCSKEKEHIFAGKCNRLTIIDKNTPNGKMFVEGIGAGAMLRYDSHGDRN